MANNIQKLDKELKDVVRQALKSGRWLEKDCKKHYKLVLAKTNETVVISCTPGDSLRVRKNVVANIKRYEKNAGFETYSIKA